MPLKCLISNFFHIWKLDFYLFFSQNCWVVFATIHRWQRPWLLKARVIKFLTVLHTLYRIFSVEFLARYWVFEFETLINHAWFFDCFGLFEKKNWRKRQKRGKEKKPTLCIFFGNVCMNRKFDLCMKKLLDNFWGNFKTIL